MRPEDDAAEQRGGTGGAAGQPQAQAAVAPAPAPVPASAPSAPAAADAQDGSDSGQRAGAVWDQPLPWAASQDDGQRQSTEPPTSGRAKTSEAPASPTVLTAAVRDEAGNGTTDRAEADREESDAEVWQAAVAEQRRGAHSAPTPVRAGVGAGGGHAVSRWILGAAVSVGGLLAAVGAAKGLGSHPSAATAQERTEPILGPDKGMSPEGTPKSTPSSVPTSRKLPTKTPTGHAPARPGPKAVTGLAAGGAAVVHPGSDHAAEAAVTAHVSPQQVPEKPAETKASGYLSARTSVVSPNSYWSKSVVTVTTTKKLTALKVVVRVSQTGGVANTGTWTSLGDKARVSSAASSGSVDYIVTLSPGVTLDPGTYTFQFQYNHNKGPRDANRDIYSVVSTAPDAGTEVREGRF
ncbi:hypothetical protein [Streptomyces caeruleatus]|uniref:Uncharacterized protein n=1 Tax=Streptomyces caeruleatus TaxID=661399 RepID=A0A117RIF8_9ACTN|nr:hypothetical protein [Streptomyces caeruleatus]KUN92548.1 hypothetical protein AQJ67_40470 [Streptomyces caeruleatus]